MASIRKEISVGASVEHVWSAIRDVGAIHTRLAPGFVVDTRLEPGARMVTFGNGMVVRELSVDPDDDARRLVWSARSERLNHHNASLQVFDGDAGGARIVWLADLLPNEAAGIVEGMIRQGMDSMQRTFAAPRQSGEVA